MTNLQTQLNQLPAIGRYDAWVASRDPKRFADLTIKFLEAAISGTGRATAYNSRKMQEDALQAIHQEMFNADRGLYALLASLDGSMDISRQMATRLLLDNPAISRDENASLLAPAEENLLLGGLVSNLPDSRQVKLYLKLRGTNNARTRGVILRTLFDQSPERLEDWALRYRMKLRQALRHAWGNQYFGGVKKLLRNKGAMLHNYAPVDERFIQKRVLRYATQAVEPSQKHAVLQCVAYILGVDIVFTLPRLKAVGLVKAGDIQAGKHLPPEVLEGLRGRYCPDAPRHQTVALSAANATKKQAAKMVREARNVGVATAFDPQALSAVELYIYAFEMGLTPEIETELDRKAKVAANMLPISFAKSAIVLDDSASHRGSREQKLRPLAVALATRDMLKAASQEAKVFNVSGANSSRRIPRAAGDTELASPLVKALKTAAEAVFVISDGYENVEAGLFAATLKRARELGVTTPVWHINPVMAAEAAGVRNLAPGLSTTVPISKPQELGATYIHSMLSENPEVGLKLLVERAARETFTLTGDGKTLALNHRGRMSRKPAPAPKQ